MNRDSSLKNLLSRKEPWDMIIIGGGATGVGTALDAAARGYSVCLLEQSDFGKGTSSRSTKLVHGGVRYLQEGDISLVMEALKERGFLLRNAPHLVHNLSFIVPDYAWWEAPFYGIGMKVYDALAGKYSFGKSSIISKEEVLVHIPTLEQHDLRGGVIYFDGQFDDSRLLIDMAKTAEEQGAIVLNYAKVVRILHGELGLAEGVEFIDTETQEKHSLRATCIINATGAFTDYIRKLDNASSTSIIAPSQGVHLVVDRSFLTGDSAIMVPHTSDGRIMFAIPWHDHVIIGTTDTPVQEVVLDPAPLKKEIDFILETASKYLEKEVTYKDILSVFAGIRPLVKNSKDSSNTASISRDFTVRVEKSGLITVAGGKWTTYRKMAESCVDHAATLGNLPEKPCTTKELNIHGYCQHAKEFGNLSHYGSDAQVILEMIESDHNLKEQIHASLPISKAEIVWAVRHEMARTVEDALSRRTRALFLNAKAAMEMAPATAEIMAKELGKDIEWQKNQISEFCSLAKTYLPHISQ